MAGRPLRQRQGRIRLPVVGDIPWRSFYFGTVLVPPLFVVAVWLFFSRVDWPHLAATRALFVSAVSLVLSVAFSMFLLNVVGRAYQRLRGVGGELALHSQPGGGTRVAARLDWPAGVSGTAGRSLD